MNFFSFHFTFIKFKPKIKFIKFELDNYGLTGCLTADQDGVKPLYQNQKTLAKKGYYYLFEFILSVPVNAGEVKPSSIIIVSFLRATTHT